MAVHSFGYTLVALLLIAWAPNAHAYIDGGTASMIFQMLIAGGLAAAVTLRTFWAQVKTFFASLLGKNSSIDGNS